MNTIADLVDFRQQLYHLFPKRKDAIMNLLDALSGNGHKCDSVVQLSNSKHFERQYSSITDAIADGLPEVAWDAIERLVFECCLPTNNQVPHRFIVDCTANPRPFAKRLTDRTMTHSPNPAPGNKPVCVGHQYSLLSYLPDEKLINQKHWLAPLSARRVNSNQKGNEVGMLQVIESIDNLNLQNDLSISIGDSLYGSQACRETASQHKNLVHIFRLNSKRNIFQQPTEPASSRGRKKEFGQKINLNDPLSQPPCDRQMEIEQVSKAGKKLTVNIQCWDNMLLRGSRQFQSAKFPLNVIRVHITDELGTAVFKRPLWIGVLGERRHEIGLSDTYHHYRARYDTEHLFRFQKRNLLIDAYQTADVAHEELWWKFCLLSYIQLYLAKNIVPCIPQPWERYLPEYKNKEAESISTPAQTQRGFAMLLDQVGTPAASCVARGRPRGRMSGETQAKREACPVIFKSKKPLIGDSKTILSASEKTPPNSKPQTIEDLMQRVRAELSQMQLSPTEFTEMLLNSS